MYQNAKTFSRTEQSKIETVEELSGFESKEHLPKVILCVAASDAHVVGNHMIAMFLRDNGLNVINLGAATPIEEIMDAYQRNPDALAIVIGSMNGHAVDDLAGLGNAKRDYQVRCPIYVGGNLSVGSQKTNREIEMLLGDGVTEIVSDPERLLSMLQALAKGPAIAAENQNLTLMEIENAHF